MPETITSLEYGTVVMTVSELTGDTPDDLDYNPDAYDIQAVVTFSPDVAARVIRVPGANPPRTAYQANIVATIDNGVLTLNDQPFVRLVASLSDSVQPRNWFWTAKFTEVFANGESISLPDIKFQLAPDDGNPAHALDLTLAATQEIVSGSTITVQGPPGAPGPALKPMPPVASFAALPTSLGNTPDDLNKLYVAADTGEAYVWTGTFFRDIGMLRGPSGGPKGDAGVSPTVSVGAVTTLDPGSPATVVVDPSSTASNVILNFGIPKGATGSPGNPADIIDDNDNTLSNVYSASYVQQQLTNLQNNIDAIPSGGSGGGGGVNESSLVSVRKTDGTGVYPTTPAQQADTTTWFIGQDFPADTNPALKDGSLFSAQDGSS